jgi:hypothetical protein
MARDPRIALEGMLVAIARIAFAANWRSNTSSSVRF